MVEHEYSPEEYAAQAFRNAVYELAVREGYSGLAEKTGASTTEIVRWSRGESVPPAPGRDVWLRRACRNAPGGDA